MSRLPRLPGNFIYASREFGLDFAVRCTLASMGIGAFPFRIVEYPFEGIKVAVIAHGFWEQFERGDWEPNSIRHVSSVVRAGQTILDVGAWIGPYTLLFSRLVGATGRVFSFEPDPNALRILCCNVEKNAATNVHVEPLCLTDSVGEARLKARRFGESLSTLMVLPDQQAESLAEVVVKSTTIDRYCDDKRIRPDGIKIDVEGSERLVLEGCWNIIETCAPWVLLEFHGKLMPEEERITNWREIVKRAKRVTFMDGAAGYRYGSEVDSMPDRENFRVFIRY
jgi:FkbM family methyltransferase